MDGKARWARAAARIRAVSTLALTQFELGSEDYDDDMLEVIDLMGVAQPPEPILAFFKGVNGVKMMWKGTIDGAPARGSIHIVTLLQAALRVPMEEEGEPLEGVLWKPTMAPELLARLKRMAIFESTAGAHLTYYADETDARLYLVEDDRARPLVTDFETTVDLLARYAGAAPLREILTFDDWRERIDRDALLTRLGEGS